MINRLFRTCVRCNRLALYADLSDRLQLPYHPACLDETAESVYCHESCGYALGGVPVGEDDWISYCGECECIAEGDDNYYCTEEEYERSQS